ncbi:MAG: response regulator transcription factor [Thiotrichaceae bacterium]|nr:response regulator transcription factor [Thiotrichaceae bacterium]
MKILIVDDEPLARARLHALVDELGIGKVIAEAGNGREALNAVEAYQPDVVLLDIRMPGIDGMQAAKQFTSPKPVLIFTTAFPEHAVEAFEHQAVDYLLKPIHKERLEQALKRAYIFLQTQAPTATPTARTHISYYLRGERLLVPVNKIYYFLAEQKYILVRWIEGEILITEALKDLEKEFAGQFLRIHRSTLVAMGHIRRLSQNPNGHAVIYLDNIEKPLEVSRRHLQMLKTLLKDMRLPYE